MAPAAVCIPSVLGQNGNAPGASIPFSSSSTQMDETKSAKCIFQSCILNLFRAPKNCKRQFHPYSLRVNIIIELVILPQNSFFTLQRLKSDVHFESLTNVTIPHPSRRENWFPERGERVISLPCGYTSSRLPRENLASRATTHPSPSGLPSSHLFSPSLLVSQKVLGPFPFHS